MIGLFLETDGQDAFVVQWQPPGRCCFCTEYVHLYQRDHIHHSSSYTEIDPNVYCNARASMNGGNEIFFAMSLFMRVLRNPFAQNAGVLKLYLSWPLLANEIITFTVLRIPNPLTPQVSSNCREHSEFPALLHILFSS